MTYYGIRESEIYFYTWIGLVRTKRGRLGSNDFKPLNRWRTNCPTLIICGSKDKANLRAAKELKEQILYTKKIIGKNAEHEMNVDSPKVLADTVNKFWD